MAPRLRLHLLSVAVALLGGSLGIIGAFIQELQSLGIGIVLIVVGAPVIEETLKPAGIYVLLVRWPQSLRGHWHTAALTALSGLVFGLIESAVYVTLYYPEGGSDFVIFRFTVPVAMHAIGSFVVGMGLSAATIDWARHGGPVPRRTRNFAIAGMGLHVAYNSIAVVLAVTGIFDAGDLSTGLPAPESLGQ